MIENLKYVDSASKSLKFKIEPASERTKEYISLFLADKDKNLEDSEHPFTSDIVKQDKYDTLKVMLDEIFRDLAEMTVGRLSVDLDEAAAIFAKYDGITDLKGKEYKSAKAVIDKELAAWEKVQHKKLVALAKEVEGQVGFNTPTDFFKSKDKALKKLYLKGDITREEYDMEAYGLLGKSAYRKKQEGSLSDKEYAKALSDIEIYQKFTTAYFTKYMANKQSILEGDKSGSIFSRIYEDNLPIFITNKDTWDKLDESQKNSIIDKIPYTLSEVEHILSAKLPCVQYDIDEYNRLINGEHRISNSRGLVNAVNELNQKDRSIEATFIKMKKMILSEGETSFIVAPTKKDIKDLLNTMLEQAESTFTDIHTLLYKMEDSKTYFKSQAINVISNKIYGDWSLIRNAIGSYAETLKTKKAREEVINRKEYNLLFIEECVEDYIPTMEEPCEHIYIKDYLLEQNYLVDVKESYVEIPAINYDEDSKFTKKEAKQIHDFAQSVMDGISFYRLLESDHEEKDRYFYTVYQLLNEQLRDMTSTYNRVRNFVTKKEEINKKEVRLFGNMATFGSSWDNDKESGVKTSLLVMEDTNDYYLAVLNAADGSKVLPLSVIQTSENTGIKRLNFKQLPTPYRQFPRIFLQDKYIKYAEGADIERILSTSSYSVNSENYKRKDLDAWIAFCVRCMRANNDWKAYYDFSNFKDPAEYKDVNEFYQECERVMVCQKWCYLDKEQFKSMVEDGSVLLFKIANRKFGSKAKGSKSLHQVLWESFVSEENVPGKAGFIKICGGANLSFRDKKIPRKITHPAGVAIQNKKSDTNVTYKYDIIKDRRFTEPQFFMTVNFTLNAGVEKMPSPGIVRLNLNQMVMENLEQSMPNIVTVTRGRRNLLYYSVVSPENNVLEKGPLNIISGTNYNERLTEIAKERQLERENWCTSDMTNIADTKSGYISQAVGIIAKLVLKYDAILVIDHPSEQFKDKSMMLEQTVYKAFELALVKKFSFLYSKEDNSALNAYQLTADLPLSDCGIQNGIMFFISNANCTVDPLTGFRNVFGKMLKFENRNKAALFFGRFDEITCTDKAVCFKFAYENFGRGKGKFAEKKFTVEIDESFVRDVYLDKKYEEINCYEAMLQLFKDFEIDTNELKKSIVEANNKKFYEELLFLFRTAVQGRYFSGKTDYFTSPIKINGKRFATGPKEKIKTSSSLIAYNMAQKGRYLCKCILDDTVKGYSDAWYDTLCK